MRLVVYARALSKTPTGRGTVAREMLLAMRRAGLPVHVDLFAAEDPGTELGDATFHPARGRSRLGDLCKSLFAVGASIRSLKPDVLWCPTHLLPVGLPADLPKVTTLLDAVWMDHPETISWSRSFQGSWAERCLHDAASVACISEFTQSRALFHWPGLEGRTHVLPLAANPRMTRIPDAVNQVRLRWGIESPFILSVGTLEPRKNLELLLDALPLLESCPLIHCGPPGWKTSALVERARRTPGVRLLGYVPEDALNQLYCAAGVAVFPAVYEGFNLPALDAASVGCPVLASDIPVHREILGEAAAYFPLGSAATLAREILRVLRSPEERLRMAAAGQDRARRFSWERSARTLFDLLEKAAARRPRG